MKIPIQILIKQSGCQELILFPILSFPDDFITCRSYKLLRSRQDPKTPKKSRQKQKQTKTAGWVGPFIELAFHLPDSRYVVRFGVSAVQRFVFCPPKRKSRHEKRDFQDSATKVKVTSLLQIRVGFVFGARFNVFRPFWTVCVVVCVCVPL